LPERLLLNFNFTGDNFMKHIGISFLRKNFSLILVALVLVGLSIPFWFVSAQTDKNEVIDEERVETNDSKGLEYVNSPEACVVPPSGLVSWWNGENNTKDVINGHNGYLSAAGVTYAPGKVGQAFSFDGVGNVSVPTNVNHITATFTIDAWVNPSLIDGDFTRIITRKGSYQLYVRTNGQFWFWLDGLSGLNNETGGIGGVNSFGFIPINNWTHIAVTYDGSRIRSYVNGVLTRTITGISGAVVNTNNSFVIGSEPDLTGTSQFDGLIDEVDYFNRALTDAEVTSIFNNGSSDGKCLPTPPPPPVCVPTPTNLVSWWRGEENVLDSAIGNTGATLGTISYSPGMVGQAFNFDGSSDVIVPSYSNLSTTNFTVGAWINPSQIDGDYSLILSRAGSYQLYLRSNGEFWYWIDGLNGLVNETGGLGAVFGGKTVSLNQWTHVSITFDGTRARSYLNGRLARTIIGLTGTPSNSTRPFVIGSQYQLTGTRKFDGLIDEVDYYSRALSATELQTIVDTGNQGKCVPQVCTNCTPTCSVPPANLVSWWRGQNTPFDFQNTNNGTASFGLTYLPGKVGQGFILDGSSDVNIPNSSSLNPTALTINAWINPSIVDADFTLIASKSGSYQLYLRSNGEFWVWIDGIVGLNNETGGLGGVYGGATIPLNEWTQVALTFDGSRLKTYINGRLSRQIVGLSGSITASTSQLLIGSEQGLSGNRKFDGQIDEVDFYNRALTEVELKAVYDSDSTGKCTVNNANRNVLYDFDGDDKSDISVFRVGGPTDTFWYYMQSSNGAFKSFEWGTSGDKPTPADFDGDGKTDLAVWRPAAASVAAFYILNSTNNTVRIEQFGQTGDNPIVVADYDGDGKADPAVFRDSAFGVQSLFYYRGSVNNPSGGTSYVPWGIANDLPATGDFDGDRKNDFAVYRGGTWYILKNDFSSFTVEQFGLATDKLVQADYDGDGKTDIAVWRPTNGTWYIKKSSNASFQYVQWGIATDVLAPADYDGDGKTDFAIYRGGNWFINRSTAGFTAVRFGLATDKPAPSSYLP
jgi:Concanavalin A-like lectin/glucanases superfamily/FG-GAP-like repeat